MRRILGIITAAALVAIAAFALVGCGANSQSSDEGSASSQPSSESATSASTSGENDASTDKDTIKIAISQDMAGHMEIAQDLIEKAGYKVEVLTYDDWTAPNTALMEGEADCNFFQHKPYMDLFNEEYNADLVMLEPTIEVYRNGLFSKKYNSFDDLPDGATVAITSDPTNREIFMKMLQDAGLVKLADKPAADYYDVSDVVDNPKNLNITTMEYYTIFTVMEDVDLFGVASWEYLDNGGDPATALLHQSDPEQALGFTVHAADAQSTWAQDMVNAVASDEYKERITEMYPECEDFMF